MLVARNYSNKGSLTIEALLVSSLLLVIIFLLCFSFILMYQRVLLTQTASVVAQKAVAEWPSGRGSPTFVQSYAGELPAGWGSTLQKPRQTTVAVEYKKGLINREAKVVIKQEMLVPWGQLQKFFSGKKTVQLQAVEKVVVAEPAKFIRHADLLMEYAEKMGVGISVSDFWDKFTAVTENSAK